MQGELVFKVVSFTPYPVYENVAGERIRIDAGPVGSCEPRTFVLEKLLPHPSELAMVTLDRPLGVLPPNDAPSHTLVLCAKPRNHPKHYRTDDSHVCYPACMCHNKLNVLMSHNSATVVSITPQRGKRKQLFGTMQYPCGLRSQQKQCSPLER